MTYSEPGIFNVLDAWYSGSAMGMIAGAVSYSQAQTNAQVLQQAIYAAQKASATTCPTGTAYAGTILFPGHSVVPLPVGSGGPDAGAEYYLAVPPSPVVPGAAVVINCNWPLRFLGTGNVKLTMVGSTGQGPTGDMFYVQSATQLDADVGGMTFEDIHLRYQPQAITGAAIHVAAISGADAGGGQNVRLVRVVLDDCPIGVWFEEALQCSMLQCTGTYTANIGTCVKIGNGTNSMDKAAGKEIYIAGCVFRSTNLGNTGIWILGTEHTRVVDTRIDNFSQGILIAPGPYGKNALRCFFSDVTVYTNQTGSGLPIGAAVTLQPQSTGQEIAQISFVGCLFEPVDHPGGTQGGAGVIVDPNGSVIDSVRFVSCYSCRWPGPGLMIKGGNNIEVLGGMYAGNNLAGSAAQAYGIYVTNAFGVKISGVSCVGLYKYVIIDGQSNSSPHQAIGIYVDLGAHDVIIDSCDLRDNSANGVYVNGGFETAPYNVFIRNCDISGYSSYNVAVGVSSNLYVTALQITNCAGYNDWRQILATTMPANGSIFYDYTYNYYGPVEFYVDKGPGTISLIQVDGANTHLITGSFYLAPGEFAMINWTTGVGGSPTFVMIAK